MDHQISNELPPVQNPDQQGPPLQSAEAGNYTGYTEQQAGQAIEAGRAPTPAADPVTQQIPQPAQAPVQQASQNNASIPAPNTPTIADDADLIEKEWVDKAKEIVARTRHDPYMQNKEVELMKADYMRKRYNKEVKIAED